MSEKYKFRDKDGIYFITPTIAGWIDYTTQSMLQSFRKNELSQPLTWACAGNNARAAVIETADTTAFANEKNTVTGNNFQVHENLLMFRKIMQAYFRV